MPKVPDGRDIADALGLDFDSLIKDHAHPAPRQFLNETIIIPGKPRVKKNNQPTVEFTRKDGSKGTTKIDTPAYRQWKHRASAELGKLGYPIAIDEAVNFQIRFYLDHDYKVDFSNLLEGPQDLLKSAGVIADDNWHILNSFNGSGVFVDPANPRIEICMTPKGQTP